MIAGRRKRGALLRDDEIGGTASADVIDAGVGDDVVESGEGADDVDGEAGNDSIEAGAGDDSVDGGAGADEIEAGGGDDVVDGGNGDDTLEGAKGDDTLDGGNGDDLLIGGSGGDTYVLSRGDDTIQGYKAGDQIVLSQELVDAGLSRDAVVVERTTIDGKEAAFLRIEIAGESFTTKVIGISEQSVLEFEEKSDFDLVVNGSHSNDVSHGNNYAYPSGHEDKFSEGTVTWTIGDKSDQKFEPENKDQAEKIDGKGGDDYIFANKGDDYIEGGADDDILYGNSGIDTVLGGPGNDKVNGNNDVDTIKGGLGDDTLNGGDGNDRVIGDQDNDHLYGNEGKDILLGGAGSDILNGGDGDDELTGDGNGIESQNDKFKASPGNDTITDFEYGDEGDQLIDSNDYEWDRGSVELDTDNETATINVLSKTSGEVAGTTTVIFKSGYDNFKVDVEELDNPGFPPSVGASDPDSELIYKGEVDGNNSFGVNGGGENNIINVEGISEFADFYVADDEKYIPSSSRSKPTEATSTDKFKIDGGGGNDEIEAGSNDDSLHGAAGNDTIIGNEGNDTLGGGADDDTLYGGDGNDSMRGWNGKDILDGGAGDDTLYGGDGNDTLNGGDGSNQFLASKGNDKIEGFVYGVDALVSPTSENVNYVWDRKNIRLIEDTNNVEVDVLLIEGSDQVVGTATITVKNYDEFKDYYDALITPGFEPSLGASDPDTRLIYKSDNKDFEAIGGKENNIISVEGINEFANYYYDYKERYDSEVGPEKPKIATSDDSYSIDGKQGDDSITGGNKDDYLHGNVGDDKLEGGLGNDRLLGGNDNDTIEGEEGNDKLFGWDGEDSLDGGNGDDYLKAENGDDTLAGGSGDDILDGGSGNDTFDGGVGNDSLIGGDGSDRLRGLGGNDTLQGGAGDDSFFASTENDLIEDFTFGEDSLKDSTYYIWDRDNPSFDKEKQEVVIDVLKKDGNEMVGTTTIKVKNYIDLIEVINEGKFPPSGASDPGTILAYAGPGKGQKNNQFVVDGGSLGNPIDLVSINDFSDYYQNDDFRYVNESGSPKPTSIAENDALSINGGGGQDTIKGGKSDDTISGGNHSDEIDGNDGDDKLIGGGNQDLLIGGDGKDTLKGKNGADVLDGGDGHDILYGSGNNQSGKNTYNDVFVASPGQDKIEDFVFGLHELEDGNSGGSSYIWERKNSIFNEEESTVTIAVANNSGEEVGKTIIKVENYEEMIEFKEDNDLAGFPIVGGDNGSESGSGSGSGEAGGNGGSGEIIPPDLGNPVDPEGLPEGDVSGGNNLPGDEGTNGGDSTIDSNLIDSIPDDGNQLRAITLEENPDPESFGYFTKGDGSDQTIKGSSATDMLRGRNGNDRLVGKNGNDYLYGGGGDDTSLGGAATDVLLGRKGADVLKGGKGNDLLYGGYQNDTLTGGKGQDVFLLSRELPGESDVITDFNVNQDGIGLTKAVDLIFSQEGDDLRITGLYGVNTLLQNVQKDDFLTNFPDNLEIVPAAEVYVI
ncbi:calcium-binding protein [Synechococcus sp. CC9616]|uniref:calcium-binding protein n=1 Tax=Synechococcus sp. CC9616 TaxID=110663 RepID=UPI0005624656|nr:calcium-binding protein [Synechococcus sp. CC9616]